MQLRILLHSTRSLSKYIKIWGRDISQFEDGAEWADRNLLNAGRSGRKRKGCSQQLSAFRIIPCNSQSAARSSSACVKMLKSIFFDILKRGEHVRRISLTAKPMLAEKHEAARFKFCLRKSSPTGLLHGFWDHVHIDGKWLSIAKAKRPCYFSIAEDPPERSCRSKRFIAKAMLPAAAAKPRWDPHKKREVFWWKDWGLAIHSQR